MVPASSENSKTNIITFSTFVIGTPCKLIQIKKSYPLKVHSLNSIKSWYWQTEDEKYGHATAAEQAKPR